MFTKYSTYLVYFFEYVVRRFMIIGLLPTNFLDLDICEILFDIYLIQKYIKLSFEL